MPCIGSCVPSQGLLPTGQGGGVGVVARYERNGLVDFSFSSVTDSYVKGDYTQGEGERPVAPLAVIVTAGAGGATRRGEAALARIKAREAFHHPVVRGIFETRQDDLNSVLILSFQTYLKGKFTYRTSLFGPSGYSALYSKNPFSMVRAARSIRTAASSASTGGVGSGMATAAVEGYYTAGAGGSVWYEGLQCFWTLGQWGWRAVLALFLGGTGASVGFGGSGRYCDSMEGERCQKGMLAC